MNARILIADDEPLLRERLVRLLNKTWPDAEIVAQAENGASARQAMRELRPDVAFLDIRMPPPDGIELAAEFAGAAVHIVFVTAYDEFAVQAFEKNACDYLLKPVSEERLKATVARLRERMRDGEVSSAVASIQAELAALKNPSQLARIPVRSGGTTLMLDVNEIRFLKTDAKYTATA